MEPWMVQLTLLTVAVIFLLGVIPVVRTFLQQRKPSKPPEPVRIPRPEQKKTRNAEFIDLVSHEEGGTTIAEQYNPRQPRWDNRTVRQTAPGHAQATGQTNRDARQPFKPGAHSVRRATTRSPAARRARQRAAAAREMGTRLLHLLQAVSATVMAYLLAPRLVGATVAIVLLLSGGFWLWTDIYTQRELQRFTVVVAPFDDSGDGQTGIAVANDLVRTLRDTGGDQLTVQVIDEAPVNEQNALTTARNEAADVLIWGDVQPGGMLNNVSLQPRLTYAPVGAYAPNAWLGYRGRFHMAQTYTLADQPINGEAVLPRLLLTLADYSAGEVDSAYDELGQLLTIYPALNGTLPQALRGNILWARGAYDEAAEAYNQALSEASGTQAASLATNLGAILLDARDSAALDSFHTAAQLPGGNTLGELYVNRGLLLLRQGQTAEALTAFEQARELLPNTTQVLLHLAAVYRETGDLTAAEEALTAAQRQLSRERNDVPESLRFAVDNTLRAAVLEQRGLLLLAMMIDARGPLTWELEVAPPQPLDDLDTVADYLRGALEATEQAAVNWRQHAVADAAAQSLARNEIQSHLDLVASGQAQATENRIQRQRYHLALALIEEGRTRQYQQREEVATFWNSLFGQADPLAPAQEQFSELRVMTSEDLPILLADARLLRLRSEPGSFNVAANQRYDDIITLAPEHPAGYYGKGMVALHAGDRIAAQGLMTQALTRDPRYFPARLQLIAFTEQDQDWDAALMHLGILAAQYPDDDTTLAIASVLRRRGAESFAEAEEILLPLANANHSAALVELGRLYRDGNQIDKAIQALERARQTARNPADAAFELGQTLALVEQYERAEQQLLAAIETGNERVVYEAHLALARLYEAPEMLNQPIRATEHYESVLASPLRDPGTLLTIGDRLLQQERVQVALEAFQRATELQPDNANTLHHLARANLAAGNLQAVRTYEQRVLDLTGGNEQTALRAAALAGLGDVERLSGNFANAANLYSQALLLDPAQLEATLGSGQIAVGQDNWAVALGHFERAINLPAGQDSPLAHFWYAEALLRQPDTRQAIDHYQRAMELRPEFPAALLGIAQAYLQLGNTDEASDAIQHALDLHPGYAEAWLFHGKLLQDSGQLDAALVAYNNAIEYSDQLGEAHYRRGMIHMKQLNYNGALRDLERATALQPDNAEFQYWQGQALFALDRIEEARNAFAQAVQLRNGNYAAARLYQGFSEEKLGDVEAAVASFQEVVQTAAENEWIIRAQSELERLGQ